jgi:RNA polymerase sigma-70 factor (ECF subfamily)
MLRRRDPGAWRALFEREMPAIYQYTASRLGSPTEAEDATSEVFEAAWEHAHTFADQGLPARAWLFGIARNVINTHRRKWVQRPPALALDAFDGGEADPALDPALIDLAHAVGSLEQGNVEVITLRFLHGLSLQETSDVLGITVDAVKGRQARALIEMRKTLA